MAKKFWELESSGKGNNWYSPLGKLNPKAAIKKTKIQSDIFIHL